MIRSNGYTVQGGAIFLDSYQAPATGTPVVVATPYSANVVEGNVLIVNVTGSNITNGTYYWRVDSNPGDFVQFAGSFEIANNTGSFSVTPAIDNVTEGNEPLNISIRSGTTTGSILTTANATIDDFEIGIYLLNGNVLQENQTLGFHVLGQNIPVGSSTIWYTVNHITTTDADFAYGTQQGAFPITVSTGNYNNVLIAQTGDGFESNEYFTVSIRYGSATGPVLATSGTFTLTNVS